ncbi:FecCD family ABC transporter permease [Egicoccus sp. AB-alg6-2]|uniref:FecCD family ABC transporter permease n=1 Tax=Egicoccus sp. AB-alg6-2 TaxID=3242692 RepID=UPI00359E7FEC
MAAPTTAEQPPTKSDAAGRTDGVAQLKRGLVGPASLRLLGLVLALVVLLVVALASLAIGSKPLGISLVLESITAFDASSNDHQIVRGLRLSRTLNGMLVGTALGLSGAIMQGVARNPLADPGILGINAGAATAVVFGIAFFGTQTLLGYIWFGFAGAAIAAVVVFTLGSLGRDGASPVKLVLAGVAVTYLLMSTTRAVTLLDVTAFDALRFWVVGSLQGRGLEVTTQAAPFVLVGTLAALLSGRLLNALALGDDVAKSLGMRVGVARAFAVATLVVLAGAATAIAGPIVFVGLTVPHIARAITGPDYRWVLPYCAVLAPMLVLTADILGRVMARPGELQVGVVAALLGAPFFILLARRRRLATL